MAELYVWTAVVFATCHFTKSDLNRFFMENQEAIPWTLKWEVPSLLVDESSVQSWVRRTMEVEAEQESEELSCCSSYSCTAGDLDYIYLITKCTNFMQLQA